MLDRRRASAVTAARRPPQARLRPPPGRRRRGRRHGRRDSDRRGRRHLRRHRRGQGGQGRSGGRRRRRHGGRSGRDRGRRRRRHGTEAQDETEAAGGAGTAVAERSVSRGEQREREAEEGELFDDFRSSMCSHQSGGYVTKKPSLDFLARRLALARLWLRPFQFGRCLPPAPGTSEALPSVRFVPGGALLACGLLVCTEGGGLGGRAGPGERTTGPRAGQAGRAGGGGRREVW